MVNSASGWRAQGLQRERATATSRGTLGQLLPGSAERPPGDQLELLRDRIFDSVST